MLLELDSIFGIIFGIVVLIFIIVFLAEMIFGLSKIFIEPLLPEKLIYHGEKLKRKLEGRIGGVVKFIRKVFWSTIAALGVWFWFIIGWLIYSERKFKEYFGDVEGISLTGVWLPVPRIVLFSVTCISLIAFALMYYKESRSEIDRRML